MQITVIGGVYFEFCYEPLWDQLYGSAGRAAAALSSHCNVRLHTRIGKSDKQVLNALANSHEFDTDPIVEGATGRFKYEHALAVPSCSIGLDPCNLPQYKVQGQDVLAFGMVDCNPIVQAKRLVYDPQSPDNPKLLTLDSVPSEAVLVLNATEMKLLFGETEDLLASAREQWVHSVVGVVVKKGAKGTEIFTDDGIVSIPPLRTSTVFPIGSGDVFAAYFSLYWLSYNKGVADAARAAAMAAAYYCDTCCFVVPDKYFRSADSYPPAPLPKPGRKIYLAGPFFDIAQRWLINQARDFLSSSLEVFSPMHDVGRGNADEVVPQDLKAIDDCDALFAICDGLDSGTIFEVGYARAQGKPVVVFSQRESIESLKMLAGSECRIHEDFATALYDACWAAWE